MKEPVCILSDLHLGHKVSRVSDADSLRPLIAGAGTVIFNGDSWQALPGPFFDRSKAMFDRLRAVCAEEGAEAVFLTGNHDPDLPGKGWVELADGRIVVTHGDTLLHSGSPWKREILAAGTRVDEIWSRFPRADHDIDERIEVARAVARELCTVEYPTGRHFIQRAIDAVLPPRRAVMMLDAWLHEGESGARFCDQYFPQAEFLILGHFHHHGCWKRGGRVVIDTGSFMNPARARWVEWKDGLLSHGEIDETTKACSKGRVLDVWRLD
jgi:predicted phosphodiesterase